MDKDLLSYDNVIVPEIERNKNPRYSWKKVIGVSMNEYITKQRMNNLSSEEVYEKILHDYEIEIGATLDNFFTIEEVRRRLKITISSHFTEHQQKEYVESKKGD